jgi:hypothetical protein
MGKGVGVETADGGRETHPEVSEHGLKEDAIGFRDALIIGLGFLLLGIILEIL